MRLSILFAALSSVTAQYNYRVCAYRGYNLPNSDPWSPFGWHQPDSYVNLMLKSNTHNVRAQNTPLARTHTTDAFVNHQLHLNCLTDLPCD